MNYERISTSCLQTTVASLQARADLFMAAGEKVLLQDFPHCQREICSLNERICCVQIVNYVTDKVLMYCQFLYKIPLLN